MQVAALELIMGTTPVLFTHTEGHLSSFEGVFEHEGTPRIVHCTAGGSLAGIIVRRARIGDRIVAAGELLAIEGIPNELSIDAVAIPRRREQTAV